MISDSEDYPRLMCLFEDYALRRGWPDKGQQLTALSIATSLVFDLGAETARVMRVEPRNDGHILAEPIKFERVYVSIDKSSEVQEEVALKFFLRGKNWILCAPSAISSLRQEGNQCIDSLWDVSQEVFLELLWAIIRWPIKSNASHRVIFVVRTQAQRQRIQTALPILAHRQPAALPLLETEVLLCPENVRAFAMLDDPQQPPEEGESYLILQLKEKTAERFVWNEGRFSCQKLQGNQDVDLTRISRSAICDETLTSPPPDVVWFHSLEVMNYLAIAHYAIWQPTIRYREIDRKHQIIQGLHKSIQRLEEENRRLEQLLQRATWVAQQLEATITAKE
ncbi:MAG: hypothetical protein JW892_16265 [Anaerolineae bacterium]|nr:hypothetical protein [Anaerolineae bacterium]